MRRFCSRFSAASLVLVAALACAGCGGNGKDKTGEVAKSPVPMHRDDVAPPGTDWSMFRGDPAQTGVAVDTLPDKLSRLWTHDSKSYIDGTAAIVGNTVYIGTGDGRLLALRLDTGEPRWSYEATTAVSSGVCVDNGRVFFGDLGGVFHAVDAATGKKLWTLETQGKIVSSAVVSDGGVLFGSYDGTLYCLEASSGEKRWTFETSAPVHASPCLVDGRVTIGGCDMVLRFIDVKTGEEQGAVELGSNVASAPACRDGRVYVGTLDGTIRCVDATKLTTSWTVEDPMLGEIHASPAVGPWGAIFATRGGTVLCLAPDGKEKWRFATRGANDSSPVVSGARVFFGSSDGKLYALDIEKGDLVWSFTAGAGISSSPAAGRGRLVIAAEDGAVFCFGAK